MRPALLLLRDSVLLLLLLQSAKDSARSVALPDGSVRSLWLLSSMHSSLHSDPISVSDSMDDMSAAMATRAVGGGGIGDVVNGVAKGDEELSLRQ